METTTITEKNFPITFRWVFKAPLITLVINVMAFLFGYIIPKLLIIFVISIVWTPFERSRFHFTFGEHFFDVQQGVFSKKTRHLPYGVIQNITVKQDLVDRLFGIASLAIEDASYGHGGNKKRGFFSASASKTGDGIGGVGNRINIPGLKKSNAEEMKAILLKKMEDNPMEDSQSGL